MNQLITRLFANASSRKAVPLLMGADLVALGVAFLLTFFVRFDTRPVLPLLTGFVADHGVSLSLALLGYLALFAAFRLYRSAWRFASLEVLWGVIGATTLGALGWYVLYACIDRAPLQRSILIIFWLLSLIAVGGMRLLLRLGSIRYQQRAAAWQTPRLEPHRIRVVILGSGSEGVRVLMALREESPQRYDILGFLDEHPERQGILVRGVPVLGPLSALTRLLETHAVDQMLVATPPEDNARLREYVLACRRQRVPVKVIPALHEVLHGAPRPRLEDISVEDLLRRPPVRIDMSGLGEFITGKRILVTGAGGSIGSELCRQILAFGPAALTLFGHGENSIHQIHQELSIRFPAMAERLHMVIGSVADDVRIEQVFANAQPQIVFHAAAHKHVPIMETNVPEAVQNNVGGTQCIAEACGRSHVERMVLISTDKAVYPSNVMGATKWLCEEIVRGLAGAYQDTTYITVRFGNVLGSRGSVVPIFAEQIRRGGPVTLTHPEMTRYFMTIPEAVQLVLQAGTVGASGEIYLLDMGAPVRIVDLAHDMIRLSGLEPDKDIPVVFIGLRPGEKLHELLHTGEERLRPAACAGMSVVQRPPRFRLSELREVLHRLQCLAIANATDELLAVLENVVPGYTAFAKPNMPPAGIPFASGSAS